MSIRKLQKDLESIYRLEKAPPVERFLITAEEAKRYLPPGSEPRPQVFFLEGESEACFAVHLPEDTLRELKTKDASRISLPKLCTAVEEISHFIFLNWSLKNRRPVSLLDVELQGEIDKYLIALAYHRSRNLFHRMFELVTFDKTLAPAGAELYRTANRLGGKFCRALGEVFDEGKARLDALRKLRRFYRMATQSRLSAADRL